MTTALIDDDEKHAETTAGPIMDGTLIAPDRTQSSNPAQLSEKASRFLSRIPRSWANAKFRSQSKSGATEASSNDTRKATGFQSPSQTKRSTRGTGTPRYPLYHLSKLPLWALANLSHKLETQTVKKPSGCWEISDRVPVHSGHINLACGSWATKTLIRVRAHVFAWELANGRDAGDNDVIMHACDNGRCVRPEHISLSSQIENMHDSIRKGRKNCFGHQVMNAEKVYGLYADAASGMSTKDMAAKYGISPHTVRGILRGDSWAHLEGAPVRKPTRRLYPNGARG